MTALSDIQHELNAIIADMDRLAKLYADDSKLLVASAEAENNRPWYRKFRITMAEHLRIRAQKQYNTKSELDSFIKRLRELM